jgi:tryptophan synthase beta chain
MEQLGARVIPVESGSRTLRDAINEAMRDWMASVETTHYCIGSVMGPHPFPRMVRDFQAIIGVEARAQSIEKAGRLPSAVIACVGGGSNAAGIFHPFLGDDSVELIGIEAAGRGTDLGDHSCTLSFGSPGVLHGSFSYVLADEDGQTAPVHSISAGLDYPGVGPEHSFWKESGRVRYESATDREALDAFGLCSRLEGIIPALETAHAIAFACREASRRPADEVVVVNFSGRGDKDCYEVARLLGRDLET